MPLPKRSKLNGKTSKARNHLLYVAPVPEDGSDAPLADFVQVRGCDGINLAKMTEYVDTASIDDEGWTREEPFKRSFSVDTSVFRTETGAGLYDEGQELLRLAEENEDQLDIIVVQDEEFLAEGVALAKRGRTFNTWEKEATGKNGEDKYKVSLKGQGPLRTIEHPGFTA